MYRVQFVHDILFYLLLLSLSPLLVQVAEWAGSTAVLTDRPQWLGKRIAEGKVALKRL